MHEESDAQNAAERTQRSADEPVVSQPLAEESPAFRSSVEEVPPQPKLRCRWAWLGSSTTMGLIGVILGTLISAGTSWVTQQSSITAANSQALRQTKSQVYFDYLNAANDYNEATGALLAEYNRQFRLNKTGTFTPSSDLINKFTNARYQYKTLVNKVYAFGSDDAWNIARKIDGTLPTTGSYEVNPLQIRHDAIGFSSYYVDFLGIVCREVVSSAREGCGT